MEPQHGDRVRVGRFEVSCIETRDGRRLAAFWPVGGGDVVILGEQVGAGR
jgi:hypothetical protein